jgi:hypothetical protein
MAKFGSKDVAWLLIDGFDIVGKSTIEEADLPAPEAVTQESHGLGKSWFEHLATGLKKATARVKGLYDDATDGINAAFATLEQTQRVVCWNLNGNAAGKKFVGAEGAFFHKYKRLFSRGGLHAAEAESVISGAVDDGIVLHALGAETVTGNTEGADSQDNGALSSNGGAGYNQVTAISGTGATADNKVKDSADDTTYANLVNFATVVLADVRKAERKTVAGTVRRHLASSWTIAGTTPSATFMIGFARY